MKNTKSGLNDSFPLIKKKNLELASFTFRSFRNNLLYFSITESLDVRRQK